MRNFPENKRKLTELILYISQQYASDPLYGTTRLNKVLYFADFLAYAKLGDPITGAEYIRERRGPVPRPVRAPARVLTQMKHAGLLRLNETPSQLLGKTITLVTPVPLREPDLTLFSEDEMGLINPIIEQFRGWRSGTISKYSHQFPQWHAVPLNETIPYELAFVAQDQRIRKVDVRRSVELAQRYRMAPFKARQIVETDIYRAGRESLEVDCERLDDILFGLTFKMAVEPTFFHQVRELDGDVRIARSEEFPPDIPSYQIWFTFTSNKVVLQHIERTPPDDE